MGYWVGISSNFFISRMLHQEAGLNHIHVRLTCRVQRVASQQAFLLKAQMHRAFERVRVISLNRPVF